MATYMDAVKWIAANDDTDWLDDEDIIPCVTVCLVADVWNKTHAQVSADVKRLLDKEFKEKQKAIDAITDRNPILK